MQVQKIPQSLHQTQFLGKFIAELRDSGMRLAQSQYESIKQIGKGKFAKVFQATKDGQVFAVKRVAIFDTMSEKSRRKCLKEIKLLESMEHEFIIHYEDSFIDPESEELVIVLEWAEGGDLKALIRGFIKEQRTFSERQVYKFCYQVASGLSHMHEKRVMHRDLKPANIMLTGRKDVKLGDLGLSRFFTQETKAAYSKVGTPLYMCPEVLTGEGYGFSADTWSLGCILYELCMLKSPFKPESGASLLELFKRIKGGKYTPIPASSSYSPELRELISSMIHLDPEARPDMSSIIEISKARYDELTELKRNNRRNSLDDGSRPTSSSSSSRPQRPDSAKSVAEPRAQPVVAAEEENVTPRPVLDGQRARRRPSHDGRTSPPLRIRRPSVDGSPTVPEPQQLPYGAAAAAAARTRPPRPSSASRNGDRRRPSSASREAPSILQQQQQQQRPSSREHRPSSRERPSSGERKHSSSSSTSSKSRGGRGGKSAVATPDVLMEDILDRLDYLQYKQSFCRAFDLPPLPHRQYFAITVRDPHEQDIQFLYLVRLICWLLAQINNSSEVSSLKTLVDVFDYEVRSKDVERRRSGFADDGVQGNAKDKVCDAVVAAVRRLRHYDIEIAPVFDLQGNSLRRPDGFIPCFVLDRLLHIIMGNLSDEIDMARVRYNQVRTVEAEVENIDAVDEQLESEEEDNGDLTYYVSQSELAGRGDRDDGRLVPFDDAATLEMAVQWPIEVERVSSLGYLKFKPSSNAGAPYFDHLRTAQRNLQTIKTQFQNMGDFNAHFKPHREILGRIQGVEGRINNSPEFVRLKEEYAALTSRMDVLQARYDEIMLLKKDLTAEQDDAEMQVEDVKQALEQHRHGFTNTNVIEEVRHGIADLSASILEMDIRAGLVQNQLSSHHALAEAIVGQEHKSSKRNGRSGKSK